MTDSEKLQDLKFQIKTLEQKKSTLTDAAEIIHISDYYGNPPLTEIRFSIATTTRGAKYDDLCISEIILLE